MDNEKLAKQLEACRDKDEILKVLADNGIDVTAEELLELVKNHGAQNSGELNESALENVAGGAGLARIARLLPLISVITPVILARRK